MNVSSGKRQRFDIDMRTFAKSAGATVKVPAGSVVFNKGDAGDCMYIVQAGVIDMMIGDKVIETIGENQALGFMSMIDEQPRSGIYGDVAFVHQGGVRTVADRRPHLPLHGGRGAELRDLHHEHAGAAHPRHGQGVVTFFLAHDLIRKPVPTFRDHALSHHARRQCRRMFGNVA